jgi:hypothetical protein
MVAYRYSIDTGKHGGMVFANDKDDAHDKLIQFYKRDIIGSDIQIWEWENDDFYKPVPDVYDCYGE